MSKSVLKDGEGNVKLVWEKGVEPDPAELIAQMEAACRDVRPPTYIIRRPTEAEDSLTLYPYADAHVGLLVWKPESGHDWDLSVSRSSGIPPRPGPSGAHGTPMPGSQGRTLHR